jgi:hypothetical protein
MRRDARMGECGSVLSKEQNLEVSDTTGADQRTKSRYQKNQNIANAYDLYR